MVKIAEKEIKELQQRCQEIKKYKMDDNELSNDDDSMGDVSHIPTDTGVNNRDAESVVKDGNDNDDDNDDEEDQESYYTKNGLLLLLTH